MRFATISRVSRLRGWVYVAIVSAILAAVIVPAASGDPYWFWQGYLPNASGDRQVFHDNICCQSQNSIRMSWEVGSHGQKFVAVRRSDYGWTGWWSYIYDDWHTYPVSTYVKGGCQNPSPYVATWTNCHLEGG